MRITAITISITPQMVYERVMAWSNDRKPLAVQLPSHATVERAFNIRFGSLADMAIGPRNVRFTPMADISWHQSHVRFVPTADIAP